MQTIAALPVSQLLMMVKSMRTISVLKIGHVEEKPICNEIT
jgi:hypothetical protein